MSKKLLVISFVILFNLWIWKIFSFSLLFGLLTILTTIFLYYKKFAITLVLFGILLISQYKVSSINSLTFLNDNEKTLQIEKMHAYPPSLYRVSNWLEARPEALVFYKLGANLSEAVDPNLYFFANHPRERIGIVEYEKFAYIFLPFFVLGIFSTKKKDLKYLFLSLSPLVLISVIGNSTPLGPFSLFPFLASTIATGLKPIFENRRYFLIFIAIFILVFIQTIAYATH